MNERDLDYLINCINQRTGMILPESNYEQVSNYVSDILQKNLMNIRQYCSYFMDNKHEYDRLMQVVTINETYFFREEKQFQYLKKYFSSDIITREPINIWSSTCSSGEEALSLYALCLSIFFDKSHFNIYSSDISKEVLEKFKSGIYRKSAFRTDGESFHPLIYNISELQSDGRWKINSEHLNNIHKYKLNLFTDSFEDLPEMDIIFLRNTLIYMPHKNKAFILDKIVKKLKVQGILFLSAAELPLVSHPSLSIEDQKGLYFFRKKDPMQLGAKELASEIKEIVRRPIPRDYIKMETSKNELISMTALLNTIEMKINNKLFHTVSPDLRAATVNVMKSLQLIKDNNLEKGFQELEKPPLLPQTLVYFLKGYGLYQKEDINTAIDNFRKALHENKNFWPAQFYLLQCLHRNSEEQEGQLLNLVKQIEDYIDNHRYDYQFLLDGFNAHYFLMITRQRLDNCKQRRMK